MGKHVKVSQSTFWQFPSETRVTRICRKAKNYTNLILLIHFCIGLCLFRSVCIVREKHYFHNTVVIFGVVCDWGSFVSRNILIVITKMG